MIHRQRNRQKKVEKRLHRQIQPWRDRVTVISSWSLPSVRYLLSFQGWARERREGKGKGEGEERE